MQGKLNYFPADLINSTPLPVQFTFPFYYQPHPLAQYAAAQLQQYLLTEANLEHNFGLGGNRPEMVIGKMFGVLVVKDTEDKVGYLWAFSGKLANSNDHPRFVPPVFDMLAEGSFFPQEQINIDAINKQASQLEADERYTSMKQTLAAAITTSAEEITAYKQQLKTNKEARDTQRAAQPGNEQLAAELVKQSLHDKRQLKALTEKWEQHIATLQAQLAPLDAAIETLHTERKERSGALQARLFAEYSFLNKNGKRKSLHDIFSQTAFGRPPSAAGECATPKLLQYAFMHGYTPLAMAEFWWGAPPKSEIRQHGQYYPACTGKCKPILAHMLEGIPMEDNPFLQPTDAACNLEILYEDAHLVVINKPDGLRTVPGVDIEDSVQSRLRTSWNGAEPWIVHRLDMGTSGLLVVARTPEAHRHLQKQFLGRTVKKRYTALLSKVIPGDKGEIRLPLSPDPYNRPQQLVDFTNGKKSITRWQVAERTATSTRMHFWPLTGRTHQLRVHSAHEQGLNAPIIGDDIYGTAAARLYLHAAQLSFIHPATKQQMNFEAPEPF